MNMTYKNFLKKVRYSNREIFVPILEQNVLKSTFIVDGVYQKDLAQKFLKAVYDKRDLRTKREEEESSIFTSPKGFEGTEE